MSLIDHINKLEYYCSVVECGSIHEASRRISITQPQLSRVVKQLEEELGKKLLLRSRTGINLTDEGAALFKTAKSTLKSLQATEQSIKYGKKDRKNIIRVGTYSSISRYFFPDFLRDLQINHSETKLALETSRSTAISDRVRKGTLDVGITVSMQAKQFSGLANRELFKDSFNFFYAEAMDVYFSNQLIVFPEAIGATRESINSFLGSYAFERYFITDSLETSLSLAEKGLGIALLPERVANESLVKKFLFRSKIKQTRSPLFEHSVHICYGKDELAPRVEGFIQQLMQYLQQHAGA